MEYPLVDIIAAEYLDGYRILFTFDDGIQKIVDFKEQLWGEMFEPLKDIELFKQFRVDSELGTIVWPNGADVAADGMYLAGENVKRTG